MARNTKSFCSPEVLQQFKSLREEEIDRIGVNVDEADNLVMFDDVPRIEVEPRRREHLVDGVDVSPDGLDKIGKILVAKFLAVCHGQPVSIIADLLGVHRRTCSRWINMTLPVGVRPLPPRTRTDQLISGFHLVKERKRSYAG